MNKEMLNIINELPEDIRQKAAECKSAEELNVFLAENDVELPDDIIEAVSGGRDGCFIDDCDFYCKKHHLACQIKTGYDKVTKNVDFWFECPSCPEKLDKTQVYKKERSS